MYKSKSQLLFLFFLSIYVFGFSQESKNHRINKIKQDVDTAYYYANKDIEKTWTLSKSIIQESKQLDYKNGLGQGWFAKGLYYDRTNQKDSALVSYLKSADIFKTDDSPMNLAYCYNSIGIMYRQLKNLDLSLAYNLQALEIYQSLKDSLSIANQWNNIANVYLDLDTINSDKAFSYYIKAEQLYKTLGVLKSRFSIHINLGIEYEKRNELEKARTSFSQALEVAKEKQSIDDEISARMNFSYLYAKLKSFKEANKHLVIAHILANKLNVIEDQLEVTDAFIHLKQEEGLYKEALRWTEERKLLSDRLYQQKRNEFLVETEIKINLAKKEKEIEQFIIQEKAVKTQRTIILISASILLLLLLILLRFQKLRHTQKQKIDTQNQQLLNTQLEKAKLEKEKIESDLMNRKKLLSNLAIHIVQKNEMLEGIEKEIKAISKSKGNITQELLSLKTDLQQQLRIGKEIEEFNFQLQIINESFYQALENKLPDLTKNEKKLAALLRLGLSTKEIAITSKSSESAIKIARHRLRKKLNMDSEVNLSDFFKSLEM